MTTTYVKELSTGKILTSTGGQDQNNPIHIEAMNNFVTSRGWSLDDYEIGFADDDVVKKQIDEQTEQAKTYSDRRATAYASIPDQLDYIYHNGVDAWKADMILPIKNKYPKEIS
jgi:hypothetical protein